MKRILMLSLLLGLAAPPGLAAARTVTLSIPGMNCAACPITVKKALEKVAGVQAVKVDLDARTATVSFDDAKTGIGQLTRATAQAGYPATVREAAK